MVNEGNVIGVKRQLVSLLYQSGNQNDEDDYMKFLIMFSNAGNAFLGRTRQKQSNEKTLLNI